MSSSLNQRVACAGSSVVWISDALFAPSSLLPGIDSGDLQKKTPALLLAVSHLLLSGLGESGCVVVQHNLGKDCSVSLGRQT